ncbi:D-alanyl-D-alanine carboxypeptidase family protein [Nakamurella endophytica]|uniref:D-alanyl-D-alanine carboxypeptidase n=1 Tax=Nakamurella endophytica TaxID=1748367 RepID=A0A917SRR7_9ACTN|nr:D-alanyl-D-alanine carboxypeptidase family protein [Nakamurella endophytica]GGL95804.1 D-alanyl-D-alanine carboxypeptidase [Nakamurella endophytica]
MVLPADQPDVPGPDDGPACSVDPQYSDEAPTGLRPAVQAAWRSARSQAARQRITLCLNDGKRSRAQQLALFDDYVRQYGSEEIARQYVLPPGKSAHVSGYAVDVQPASAYRWLQATTGRLGWCRIYDNEPWHFEYAARYRSTGCPPRLPEPEG